MVFNLKNFSERKDSLDILFLIFFTAPGLGAEERVANRGAGEKDAELAIYYVAKGVGAHELNVALRFAQAGTRAEGTGGDRMAMDGIGVFFKPRENER